MYRNRRLSLTSLLALLMALALVAAACGSDDGDDTTAGGADVSGEDGDGDTDGEGSELPNACPAEGCLVSIEGAEADPSGEITLTFSANFTPDFERNHIHVFWGSQEPGAVSSDFEAQGFEVQGKWHPTDEFPVYVTQSDAAVDAESRGGSTEICVTAADTDHAVIDASKYECRDVSDLVS